MYSFELLSLMIVLTATLGYINVRFFKLPNSIGLMLLSLILSVLAFTYKSDLINLPITHWIEIINNLNFSQVVFDVMLSSLLFAGAMHTDFSKLRENKLPILMFAIFGTFISTFTVAVLMNILFGLFGIDVPFIYCLIFGAFISPTDPIAVLSILNKSKVPEKVKINIVGESLFNDGIGVVLFVVMVKIYSIGIDAVSTFDIVKLFALEVGGGLMLGFILGYIIYLLLKSIDDYEIEILITLAVILGGSWIAKYLHVSGPLAMVVAGIITNFKSREKAMSDTTEVYVYKFWHLMDMILNSLLFVMIGLKISAIHFEKIHIVIGLISIPLILLARYFALNIPHLISRKWNNLDNKAITIMTWGGLRGGLSIAMALSLSHDMENRDLLISITYIIVMFSILAQGLSIQKLVSALYPSKK